MKLCSHSRLALYDRCPAAYDLRYHQNVPEEPSDPLMEGSITHRAIADYNRHLIHHRLETDLTAVAGITRLAWQTEKHSLPAAKLPEIERTMETFARSHALDYGSVVGVEEWFRGLTVAGVDFRGIRDLLQITGATAIVRDYKTDWQVRSQADVEGDFQLAVYAWATAKEYPQLDKIVAVLDFVRHRVERQVEFDRADTAAVEERLAAMIARVRADKKFAPTPGAQCSWCSYTNRCPAVAALSGQGKPVIVTAEDAVRVAGELALLERQVAERKQALQGYCNLAGPVTAGGLAWGFWKTDSRAIEDLAAFRRVLAKHGLDPDLYLRVDAAATKKLWRDDKLAAALEAISVDRSYTRFDSRKVKAGDVA